MENRNLSSFLIDIAVKVKAGDKKAIAFIDGPAFTSFAKEVLEEARAINKEGGNK